jgi:predicted AAA+ superfamily ATPase
MFKRKIYPEILEWKQSLREKKKGLIIQGLRQVGKTTVALEFAKKEYPHYLYINFKTQKKFRQPFEGDLSVDVVITLLSALVPTFEFIPGKTLLIFDEIQECNGARTAIKSFMEDGRYDILATGSLLGVKGYNRGKSEGPATGFEHFLQMKPMDFEEFLWAKGLDEKVISLLKKSFETSTPVNPSLNDTISRYFREYLVVGGMPEAVAMFLSSGDMGKVLSTQRDILESFKDDFGKHLNSDGEEVVNQTELARIDAVYSSLPAQLGKENKQFKYAALGGHAKGREYRPAIQWLEDFGLVNLCYNLTELSLPLEGNKDPDSFKVYLADTGLFVAMLEDGSAFSILNNDLEVYKGAIYENIVADAFSKIGKKLFYFSKGGKLEIDFVTRHQNEVTLIEVKAHNGNAKSLRTILEDRNRYHIKANYKLVDGNCGSDGLIVTIPHYMAFLID